AVEELADLDERQVERPERGLQQRVRRAQHDRDREAEADPRGDLARLVRGVEPEHRRQAPRGVARRAGPRGDVGEKAVGWEDPVVAEQWALLIDQDEE